MCLNSVSLLLLVIGIQVHGCAQPQMQTTRHGLNLIFDKDIPKEQIVSEIRFTDGFDGYVNVIRIDNIGAPSGDVRPLIMSIKQPIQTDSLGLYAIELDSNTLGSIINTVRKSEFKSYHRPPLDNDVIRVTYRIDGSIDQYYVPDQEKAIVFLKQIEKTFKRETLVSHLEQFYFFLASSTFVEFASDGSVKWKLK